MSAKEKPATEANYAQIEQAHRDYRPYGSAAKPAPPRPAEKARALSVGEAQAAFDRADARLTDEQQARRRREAQVIAATNAFNALPASNPTREAASAASIRRITAETELRRVAENLPKAQRERDEAATRLEQAKLREVREQRESRKLAIDARWPGEYETLTATIIGLLASSRRLDHEIERISRRPGMQSLPTRGILSSKEFLRRLSLPARREAPGLVWIPEYDADRLDKIEPSPLAPIKPLADGSGRIDGEGYRRVRGEITDANRRLEELYKTTARRMLELLDAEWRVRRDIREYNAKLSAVEQENRLNFPDRGEFDLAVNVALPKTDIEDGFIWAGRQATADRLAAALA